MEHRKNMDSYTTGWSSTTQSAFVIYNWIIFSFNELSYVLHTPPPLLNINYIAKTSKKTPHPAMPNQLPGSQLHKVFSHVSVISPLAGLMANNKEFSPKRDSSSSTLQNLTDHQALSGTWDCDDTTTELTQSPGTIRYLKRRCRGRQAAEALTACPVPSRVY